jgi:hypothetical protein
VLLCFWSLGDDHQSGSLPTFETAVNIPRAWIKAGDLVVLTIGIAKKQAVTAQG